jgi:hypothetical protein
VAPILLHPSSRAVKCAQSPWRLCHIRTDFWGHGKGRVMAVKWPQAWVNAVGLSVSPARQQTVRQQRPLKIPLSSPQDVRTWMGVLSK